MARIQKSMSKSERRFLSLRSLRAKILLFIGVPIAAAYLITAIISLNSVQHSVSNLTTENLSAKSQSAAHQINTFFSEYISLASQLSKNVHLQNIILESNKSKRMDAHPDCAKVMQYLKNIHKDKESLLAIFFTAADAEQLLDSTGVNNTSYATTQRPWFIQMQAANGLVLTEPYEDVTTGQQVVTIAAPVYRQGAQEIAGAVALDLTLSELSKGISSYTLGQTGYFLLATKEGKLIYHPDADYINTNIADTDMSDNIKEAVLSQTTGDIIYTLHGEKSHGYVSQIGDTGWVVATGLPDREYAQSYANVRTTMLLIFGSAALLLFFIILLVAGGISKPLRLLTQTANQIADGNLDVQVSVYTQDETGQVATAINRTVVRLSRYIDYIREVTQVLKTMAQGDMRIRLEQDYAGEFAPVKQALMDISSSLSKVLLQIQTSAGQVDSGASQMSNAAQALAAGASEQASSIQQLSASITEISGKAAHNTENVAKATGFVEQAGEKVEESNEYMQEMLHSMKQINESSQKINQIIKTIDDIAFQTNILALNAAVEAARAGTAGKGFAVVADEVRNLAAKAAKAAKDTEELIHASIQTVQDGSRITEKTASALVQAAGYTKQVQDVISNIRDDSTAQADSIAQVTQGVEQISGVVQTNAATAEETSASSEELSAQVVVLHEEIGRFKLAASQTPVAAVQEHPQSARHGMAVAADNTGDKY